MIISEKDDPNAFVISLMAVLLSTNPFTNVINIWANTFKNEKDHQTFKDDISELFSRVGEIEKFQKEIFEKVDRLISELPSESVQCPQMDVVYPLAQSVLINEIDDEMKLMYANLFVNASSKETSRFVHPSFASIINQLTVDEIKLFKQFENSPSKAWPIVNIMDRNVTILTNYTNIGSGVLKEEKNICAYIDNLSRLNLILIEPGVCLADENRYKPLKELNPVVSELISNHIYKHTQLKYEHRTIRLTNLGRMFKRACFNQEEI